MKNYWFKTFFLMTMMSGSILAISSYSWFSTWMGLEINLLAMIAFMKNSNKTSAEMMIKYFMSQIVASIMFLLATISLSMNNPINMQLSDIASIIVNSMLFYKMGMVPMHFWFPEIMSGATWEISFYLMTWQKIAPIMIMSNMTINLTYAYIIIITSALISSLLNLNQTCLRKIMAYSSINHISWMVAAMLNSITIWYIYFSIYVLINFSIIMVFKMFNIFYMNQLTMLFSTNKKMKYFFFLNFLSLGGLPPFLGFLPKWLMIYSLTSSNMYMLAIMLIIITLISLYVYIRISFSSLIMNTQESLVKAFNKVSFFNFMLNTLSILGLMIMTIFTNYL